MKLPNLLGIGTEIGFCMFAGKSCAALTAKTKAETESAWPLLSLDAMYFTSPLGVTTLDTF